MDTAIVDMFTSLPTAERAALEIRSWGSDPGYSTMFAKLWAKRLSVPLEIVEAVRDLEADDFVTRGSQLLEPFTPALNDVLRELRGAGICKAVVHGPLITDVPYSNDATAALVAQDPDLLVGFARIDPTHGEVAAEEVRRSVLHLGLRGVTITPFWHNVRCSDPEVYPIFRAAEELRVPVWVHTSINWRTDRPLALEAPYHIDEVAGRFPTVPIICGHGGWPRVLEMVAVAWRHPNVYIDLAAFRPRHIFTPGSGWEALVYYGQRTIADRLTFGTTWSLLGMTPQEVVTEAKDVSWPESVKQRWLHDNAWALLQAGGRRPA